MSEKEMRTPKPKRLDAARLQKLLLRLNLPPFGTGPFPARRALNRQALASAPVLERAGDENFPVARGAGFIVAVRSGD